MHKDLLKFLENFSAISKAAVDSCSRFQDITTKNTERLVQQQLEMMQLGGNSDQMKGIKEITEIVMKKGERMAQQQLDLLKLSIDSSTEFLKESSDAEDIKAAMKAQREFAEGLSSSMLDNAQLGYDLCIETQSEIRGVVKEKMKGHPRKPNTRVKKSRKISGSMAQRSKNITPKNHQE
ncbi:MAG: phasin family protein [Gammaproteobacteria bacterium]|nr:MAG: phasin family protein [Gammaproteobacteria bacterium]